jgi:hypothetical protein
VKLPLHKISKFVSVFNFVKYDFSVTFHDLYTVTQNFSTVLKKVVGGICTEGLINFFIIVTVSELGSFYFDVALTVTGFLQNGKSLF